MHVSSQQTIHLSETSVNSTQDLSLTLDSRREPTLYYSVEILEQLPSHTPKQWSEYNNEMNTWDDLQATY